MCILKDRAFQSRFSILSMAARRMQGSTHRTLHSRLWETLRDTQAQDPSGTVGSIPGFIESLRILREDECYALVDIGRMFGVSRERVRQWCRVYQIGPPKFAGRFRYWDDSTMRFRPVGCREHEQQQRLLHRQQQQACRAQRRVRLATIIRGLARELQRAPTLQEILEAYYGRAIPSHQCAPRLIALWRGKVGPTAGILHEIHEITGVPARARGGRGHVHPRLKKY